MEKTLNFSFKKETLHTYVYEQAVEGEELVDIPSLYIRKSLFEENQKPEKIQVVIKFEENK